MNAMRHPIADCIIHKPMFGKRAQTCEALTRYFYPVMPSAALRTCVASVKMAFIFNNERRVVEVAAQSSLDISGGRANNQVLSC